MLELHNASRLLYWNDAYENERKTGAWVIGEPQFTGSWDLG